MRKFSTMILLASCQGGPSLDAVNVPALLLELQESRVPLQADVTIPNGMVCAYISGAPGGWLSDLDRALWEAQRCVSNGWELAPGPSITEEN